MNSEFEEKTYESYLTSELVKKHRLFSPGQVLEKIVGFDVALKTNKKYFLKLFRHIFWVDKLNGITLKPEWWSEIEKQTERFPKFKFNCFIQAKRPEKLKGKRSAEYSYWNKPYFRFDTFATQQQALILLAQRTSGRALVVYACPAFHTNKDLWESCYQNRLVKKSNFCEVEKLKGHRRYSFVSPGNMGIAHSEPTPIESQSFELALEGFQDLSPHESNLAFLKETVEDMDSATKQMGELRKAYYFWASRFFEKENAELARLLAKIYSFQLVCNVQLLIGYDL